MRGFEPRHLRMGHKPNDTPFRLQTERLLATDGGNWGSLFNKSGGQGKY